MKAHAHAIRIAPKKANLIAKMVRGMSVPDAVEALRKTHKKGARMMETLLRSAIANASHNDKQDPQMMIIKTVVVNQGEAYRRGMPKARGQVRPFKKFLSHISIHLGFADTDGSSGKKQKSQRNQKGGNAASQEKKTPVKKAHTGAKKQQTSSDSSASSASSAS